MLSPGVLPIITDRLKDELGVDKIFSNQLVFKDGKLDDINIKVTSDKASSSKFYNKGMGNKKR